MLNDTSLGLKKRSLKHQPGRLAIGEAKILCGKRQVCGLSLHGALPHLEAIRLSESFYYRAGEIFRMGEIDIKAMSPICSMWFMNRTIFLIDGFNLYHSVKSASRDLGLKGRGTKWLNIYALCSSYLHLIGEGAAITCIYYFSALAKHLESRNPFIVRRHQDFIRCLESTGVTAELGRFKAKDGICTWCNKKMVRYEEKETDVAIAVKLFELSAAGGCDTIVVMTGDTDIAPAVRASKRLFPHIEICFLFPYGRKKKNWRSL